MRLVPVRENPDDFADFPELLSTAVSARTKESKGQSEESGETTNMMGAVTFSLWLVACIMASTLAFTEFSSLWMVHMETLLPAPVASVAVPALRAIGSAVETLLRVTHLDTL